MVPGTQDNDVTKQTKWQVTMISSHNPHRTGEILFIFSKEEVVLILCNANIFKRKRPSTKCYEYRPKGMSIRKVNKLLSS